MPFQFVDECWVDRTRISLAPGTPYDLSVPLHRALFGRMCCAWSQREDTYNYYVIPSHAFRTERIPTFWARHFMDQDAIWGMQREITGVPCGDDSIQYFTNPSTPDGM